MQLHRHDVFGFLADSGAPPVAQLVPGPWVTGTMRSQKGLGLFRQLGTYRKLTDGRCAQIAVQRPNFGELVRFFDSEEGRGEVTYASLSGIRGDFAALRDGE